MSDLIILISLSILCKNQSIADTELERSEGAASKNKSKSEVSIPFMESQYNGKTIF